MSADPAAIAPGADTAQHAHPVSGRRGRLLRHALRYLALAVALVFFLFPIVWMVSMSFKLPGEYLRKPPVLLPQHPTFNHYVNVMQAKGWPLEPLVYLGLVLGLLGLRVVPRLRPRPVPSH